MQGGLGLDGLDRKGAEEEYFRMIDIKYTMININDYFCFLRSTMKILETQALGNKCQAETSFFPCIG